MPPTNLPSEPTVARRPSDPFALSSLLEDTFGIVRAHPFLLLTPLVLLALLTAGDGRPPASDLDAETILAEPLVWLPFFALFGVLALAIAIVLFVAYVWAGLATAQGALALVDGAPAPTLGATFASTRALLIPSVGTALLWVLFVVLGFVALVVPGFIVMAALLPLGAVVVAERVTGMEAVHRAWQVSRGHRWALFGALLLSALAGVVATLALSWLPILGDALAAAAGGAAQAVLAVVAVVYYRRIRPTIAHQVAG